MTAGLFRDRIVELYRNDRLMRGEFRLRGRRVSLGEICANLLNIVAMHDRVAPPVQRLPALAAAGSADKMEIRISGAHVRLMDQPGSRGGALAADRGLVGRALGRLRGSLDHWRRPV